MKWWTLALWLGAWNSFGVAAVPPAYSDTKQVELLRGMPLRMAQSVFFNGKLFFSLERTDGPCPAQDLFMVTLDRANSTKVVERVSQVPCLIKLEADDKSLFVQSHIDSQNETRLEILVDGKLYPIEQTPFMGTVFLDRRAWLKFELHKLADKLGDPSLREAFVSTWEVKSYLTPEGTGTMLHFILMNKTVEGKSQRFLYGRFPLEDSDRKKRKLVLLDDPTLTVLPVGVEFVFTNEEKVVLGTTPIRVFSGETGKVEAPPADGGAFPLVSPRYLTASSQGVLLASGIRDSRLFSGAGIKNQFLHFVPESHIARPLRAQVRDVSGLSRVEDGLLMTKGWTGSVVWSGGHEPEGALKDWASAKDFTISSSENGKVQPVASAQFVISQYPQPLLNTGCTSHQFSQEKAGVIGVYRTDGDESVPLGWFEGVASGACSGTALALLAKRFTPYLSSGHLRIELEAEGSERAGEGGTNVEQAMALTMPDAAKPVTALTSDNPNLYLLQKDALVLVRKALDPTSFFRIRPNGEMGFFLWLQAGNQLFTDYINTAAVDGRDFYNASIEEHPLPHVDATHFETEIK